MSYPPGFDTLPDEDEDDLYQEDLEAIPIMLDAIQTIFSMLIYFSNSRTVAALALVKIIPAIAHPSLPVTL